MDKNPTCPDCGTAMMPWKSTWTVGTDTSSDTCQVWVCPTLTCRQMHLRKEPA